jgi:hypothetical protein
MATTRAIARRRKYRFQRIHKLHYYVVSTGLIGAMLVCVLNTAAYLNRSPVLASIAFSCVLLTSLVIFTGFFLGITMVMGGNIPVDRIKYLIPHAAVGVLSPLFYTINVSIDLDRLGQPLSGWSLFCGFICLANLLVQFAMGKAVVRSRPLYIVPVSQGRERPNGRHVDKSAVLLDKFLVNSEDRT